MKHCDEDNDTDSEILRKTIGLCERDLKDLDNMMDRYGRHRMQRKVHNYKYIDDQQDPKFKNVNNRRR